MRVSVRLSVIVIFFIPALVVAASPKSTALSILLDSIITLTADFEQTVKNEKDRYQEKLKGQVWLKKPTKFRWEVLDREPRLIISDGKKVWDFDKELDQVTVQSLGKGHSRTPIFFLTGNTQNLDQDFTIRRLQTTAGKCLRGSNQCFELKPKGEEGSFQWIRIGFKNNLLKELQLFDQLGQHSFFVFKNVKINQKIADKIFSFSPPAHVDVLTND